MKFILTSLLFTIASFEASASPAICKAIKSDQKLKRIATVAKKNPKEVPALTSVESRMVQLAVIWSGTEPMTPADAAAEFFDTKYDTTGGDINYVKVTFKNKENKSKTAEVALVTYYPGDNEYGLIFRISRDAESGNVVAAYPLMSVGDGDLTCLSE